MLAAKANDPILTDAAAIDCCIYIYVETCFDFQLHDSSPNLVLMNHRAGTITFKNPYGYLSAQRIAFLPYYGVGSRTHTAALA